MTNRSPSVTPPDQRRNTLPGVLTILAIVAALTTLTSLVACSPSSDSSAPTAGTASNVTLTSAQRQHIRLYTVASSTFHKTVEASGAVDFDNDQATSVLAPFSGPVSRLLVAPGDHVAKGAALAVVASPDFAAAIGTYRKALATAQTTRRLANLDKDLLAHQGVSQREEEQAQTDAINAEADRQAALQALVALDVPAAAVRDLRRGRMVSQVEGVIRSPLAGTVVEKLITPGQLLQAGSTPCFTVANLSRVWVMAQIFDTDLASVAVGDHAEVLTGVGSSSISGTVANISALVDPDTRSVVARIVVDNPRDLLKKRMYVRVRIEAKRETAGLLIPTSAILRDDENLPFVYVLQRDGGFARRHVTMGYRTGNQFNITDGLRLGDQIMVDGAIFVQFMQSQ